MDVVVTVPKDRWEEWIAEGDCAGDPWGFGDAGDDGEYHFYLGGRAIPAIHPGERVYVVAHGRLRGYAPLLRREPYPMSNGRMGCALVRQGDAVAVTIPRAIDGFRGWRYRWWPTSEEYEFPDWRTEGIPSLAASGAPAL